MDAVKFHCAHNYITRRVHSYGRSPRCFGPLKELVAHQLVRALRPVAQDRPGVAGVDDLLDAEALGRPEGEVTASSRAAISARSASGASAASSSRR
jgi:hypothetical protein